MVIDGWWVSVVPCAKTYECRTDMAACTTVLYEVVQGRLIDSFVCMNE